MLDGTQWKAVFEYINGYRVVEFAGSNDYPYNFAQFMELFRLDGGKDTSKYTV